LVKPDGFLALIRCERLVSKTDARLAQQAQHCALAKAVLGRELRTWDSGLIVGRQAFDQCGIKSIG
jgi:hypothetical protein